MVKSIVLFVGDVKSKVVEYLKEQGMTVCLADSVMEARALWPAPGFNLLIIDEDFSEWDNLATGLRDVGYNGPIYLLTNEKCSVFKQRLKNFASEIHVVLLSKKIEVERLPKIFEAMNEIYKEPQLVN